MPAAGAGRAHAPAKATGRGGTASGEGETSPDQDESGRGACRRSMTRKMREPHAHLGAATEAEDKFLASSAPRPAGAGH